MKLLRIALLMSLALVAPAAADDISNWSPIDGNNTRAPPNGWPVGMLPSQVRPTAQAMMGAIRRFYDTLTVGPWSVQQTWGTGLRAASGVDGQVTPLVQFDLTSNQASTPHAGSAPLALLNEFGNNSDLANCTLSIPCSHFGLWSNLYKNGTTVGGAFDTGVFSNVTATNAAPAWQPSGAYVQSLYGFAAQVSDNGGGYYGVTGGEIDVNVQKNNDNIKEGWAVASVPLAGAPDLYQGLNYSAGYGLWAGGSCGAGALAGGSACAGFKIGMSFGRSDGYFPIQNNGGSIIAVRKGTGATMQTDYGIRFVDDDGVTPVQFNICAFRSEGICIDGNGFPKISSPFPTIQFLDTGISTPNTNGGLIRFTSDGTSTDQWQFQINTASAGDFSTTINPLTLDPTGVRFPIGFFMPVGTPSTSSSPCGIGQMEADATYIYTCVATNTWHRVSNGATW